MRAICEEFFAARMPIAGLAACAARLPNGIVIHQCFNRWLLPAQIRQAMVHLTQTPEILLRNFELLRMGWAFEHLRVHVGLRPDKACLALFLENRSDLPLAEIDSLLEDFSSLRLPDPVEDE